MQKCIYCGIVSTCTGWSNLCDRRCYYNLKDLLFDYESGSIETPDPRIVEYFTLNPDPSHSFFFEKLKGFLSK